MADKVNIQMFEVKKLLEQFDVAAVKNNCFDTLVYLRSFLEYKVYLKLYKMEYMIIQMVLLVLDQTQIFFLFTNVFEDIDQYQVEIVDLIIYFLMVYLIMEMYFQNQNV